MADLHHEIRRDRRQHVGGTPNAGQRERYQVGAVGVDDAARLWRGFVDAPVQRQRLAGAVARGLHAMTVDARQPRRVQRAQAGIGGGDQEAVGQVRAVVAMKALRVVNG